MTITPSRFALSSLALAAALALGACHRNDERVPTAQTDTPPPTLPAANTSGTGSTTPAAGDTSSTTAGSVSSSGTMAMPSAPLTNAEQEFVTKAAEGGMFEVEIGKMAAAKAVDPAVKSFGQMLADDHGAANDKLKQIASAHNVPLPAALPSDKKKELDELSKLSGKDFDKQFVKTVGIKDHHHDIAEFEKAARMARSDDVKSFAQSSLPTLQKHLAAAEKLPAKG
jgi:putative membrane protein